MNSSIELFQSASARLTHVNEEMNRPEEDVMTFSICHQTRAIIIDLMKSWLAAKGEDHNQHQDLESIYVACCSRDERFLEMDVRGMFCYTGKEVNKPDYCLDMEQVKSCLTMANKLHDEVLNNVQVDK